MYKLLIADDEKIERAVLYQMLTENLEGQCLIFQAENGREALEIYQKEKIQIVILDIEMPGINGIEAAEKIREHDKDCCIIFLTAFDEFSYARKAVTIRALDYLLKPYDERELMLVLDEAMRQIDEIEKHRQTQQQLWDAYQTVKGEAAVPSLHDASDDIGNVRLSKVTELLLDYIQQNYMYDISMHDVARTMNYSETYFCKLFKQCFDKNFTSYLTEYRVHMAQKMLAQPTINVKDIAKAVGYADSNYFAKVFKRITGQSPTEYRTAIFRQK